MSAKLQPPPPQLQRELDPIPRLNKHGISMELTSYATYPTLVKDIYTLLCGRLFDQAFSGPLEPRPLFM